MIYATYNVETGELLGVAAEIKPTSGYPLQVAMLDFDYPIDLGRYEWVPNLATFAPKAALRRVSKLDFVERLGDPAFSKLLELSLSSIEILKFVKLIDWTTPEADGTSIDLDDPRVQKVRDLEPLLLSLGVSGVAPGWADEVLA